MSTVNQVNVGFIPFFRDPKKPIYQNKALIGRWGGQVTTNGDGSGGYCTCVFYLGDLFYAGHHWMWDLQIASWYTNIAGPTMYILQLAQEVFNGGVINLADYYGSVSNRTANYPMLQSFPHKLSNGDGVQIYTANGIGALQATAGGFIYDEALM